MKIRGNMKKAGGQNKHKGHLLHRLPMQRAFIAIIQSPLLSAAEVCERQDPENLIKPTVTSLRCGE